MGDEDVLLASLTKAPALYLVASVVVDWDSWEIGISIRNHHLREQMQRRLSAT